MKNSKLMLAVALTAVVMGGVGFWGGNQYSQNIRSSRFGQMGNRIGARPNGSTQPGSGMRGGMILGEVSAKDDKSITVKMPDGSSKLVILSSTTTYRTATEISADELQVGKNVVVQGTQNADGSTTASSIELNPVMRGIQGSNK